jgi:hypothetical protein
MGEIICCSIILNALVGLWLASRGDRRPQPSRS